MTLGYRGRMIGWCAILLLSILCVLPASMALNTALMPLTVTGTLIVNDTGDEEDADPMDGACATDNNVCTLRAAIQQANARATSDGSTMALIAFNLSGNGPHFIQPTTPLPPITAPVLIDGTTQPGFDDNMNAPVIVLDGLLAGNEASGLTLASGNSAIQGLLISNFAVHGVFVNNSHNNVLGAPNAGNVISSNMFEGILISGSSTMNQIQDNIVNNNAMNGIAIPGGGLANTIQANSINNNMLNGILISGTSTLNEVQGNMINNNMFNGILISGTSTMNDVQGNTINENMLNGILISGTSTANAIRGNSIFFNALLGIDLGDDGVTPNDIGDEDTGANNLQNAPEISTAVNETQDVIITGRLASTANTMFTLEFFTNMDCDPSEFGEGETFIGSLVVETDNAGNAAFEFAPADALTEDVFITATATDANGNTSEFSECATTE